MTGTRGGDKNQGYQVTLLQKEKKIKKQNLPKYRLTTKKKGVGDKEGFYTEIIFPGI